MKTDRQKWHRKGVNLRLLIEVSKHYHGWCMNHSKELYMSTAQDPRSSLEDKYNDSVMCLIQKTHYPAKTRRKCSAIHSEIHFNHVVG